MKRNTSFIVAALAGTAVLFGTHLAAASQPQDAKRLKIVSSLPRTGSANAQTQTMVNGIRMAIDERGGKVDGYVIDYEDMDDASPQRGNWDPQVESANANKAAKDESIVGYIGTFNSGAAKIAMPILNKVGLVMISPANTAPGLTKPGLGEPNEPAIYRPSGKINYFRVVPTDDLQGAVAASWAKELGVKKVFLLHDREVYGKGIADVFKTTAGKIGVEVVGFEGIDAKASNYRSLMTKIRGMNPDMVYFGGTTQSNAAQVLKDMRAAGLKIPFMSPDGTFEKAFITSAGRDNVQPEMGGVYITFGGLPSDKLTGRGAEFVEKYKKQYGEIPEAYAVYGYEAARVLLDAIDRAETKDRASILAAVAATKNFEGALGTWSFDENGDTTNRVISGNTIKGDDFEFVKVLLNSDVAKPANQG
ncbi:MAG: branched-chain amino acid ABC transporter substrate-binding protein [Phycisphaerae bacterium]|nr:branched-chain amino acid ABC transporter substrate-binding protein [Phycisphaerae bacterium]